MVTLLRTVRGKMAGRWETIAIWARSVCGCHVEMSCGEGEGWRDGVSVYNGVCLYYSTTRSREYQYRTRHTHSSTRVHSKYSFPLSIHRSSKGSCFSVGISCFIHMLCTCPSKSTWPRVGS